MPQYGEVAYTLTDVRIAPFNALTGQYGTSRPLEYLQTVTFEPQADTDELKAQGLVLELLTVPTHGQGTISQGAISFDAYQVMLGLSSQYAGTTPTRYDYMEFLAGVDLPYFGMIGKMIGLNGSDVHIGLRKCKLDSIPPLSVEQNTFVMPETGFRFIAPDATSRKMMLVRRNETGVAIATNFNTFFGVA